MVERWNHNPPVGGSNPSFVNPFSVKILKKDTEKWLSGRKRWFAKPIYILCVSWVQIPFFLVLKGKWLSGRKH